VITSFDENIYIHILLYILFLIACWQIQNGGLYLHSSAVLHSSTDKGFLFLGASGEGKTTVTQLSVEAGHTALGDDLNLVIQDKTNVYKLAATPSIVPTISSYSMLHPYLQGIFKLVKDDHDDLIPLSPRDLSIVMFESLKQIPKAALLPDQTLQQAFQTISSVSSCVPGFELHFKKRPDFWKLIDEQFSV
jgi:hypothetical protein